MSSNQQTPLTQKLLSLSLDEATSLADNRSVNYLIAHSGYMSLTLFRRALIDIASMRSRKFAAKAAALLAYGIESNPVVSEYVKSSLVHHMLNVITAHVVDCVPYVVTTSDIRIMNHNNTPGYTPVFVGDSEHFISCLRIGYYTMKNTQPTTEDALERCIKRTPKGHPVAVDWQHVNTYRGTYGCNVEFLDAEVKAFGAGVMFYVGVGSLPFEGVSSKGLSTRMRCVRINGRSPKIIINRIYGDDSRVADMINKLKETFPKHKILVPAGLRQLGLTLGNAVIHKESKVLGKVYTDYCYDTLRSVVECTRPKNGYSVKGNTQRKRVDLLDRDGDAISMRTMQTHKDDLRSSAKYSHDMVHRREVYDELRDNYRNYTHQRVTSRLPRIVIDIARSLGYFMYLANNGYDYYTKGDVLFSPLMSGDNNDKVEGVTWIGTDRRRYNVIADKWSYCHYLTRGTRVKEIYSVDLRRWMLYTGDLQHQAYTITERNQREIKQLILRTLR